MPTEPPNTEPKPELIQPKPESIGGEAEPTGKPRDETGRFVKSASEESPAEAALEKIKIGDKEFELPKATADIVRAQQAMFEAERATLRGEITQLKAPAVAGPTVVEKIDVYKDLGTRIWEDTPSALKAFEDKIVERVRGEYQAAKGEEAFWDDFYRENPELDRAKDHRMAKAIINENYQRWHSMPIDQVKVELAKRTRDWALDVQKRFSPVTGKPLSATLEGGSPPSPKATPRETETKVLSLGQIIKQKNEMRQAAMRQRGAVKES